MNYAKEIGKVLLEKKLKISTCESCTGGLLSSKLTDVSGSSAYITLNLITYANEAKQKMLNVSEKTLKELGAVSEACAFEMAKGLFVLSGADICVSTTGTAGPTGGTPEKPVGLMYSCIYSSNKYRIYKILLDSELSRIELKENFTNEVLKNIYEFIN